MSIIIPLLSNILLKAFNPFSGSQSPNYRKCTAHVIAFLFMVGGYIIASIGLYYYLILEWGRTFSCLAVASIWGVTSLVFLLIGCCFKPKPSALTTLKEGVSDLEKNVAQTLHQLPSKLPNSQEVIEKVSSYVSPKTLGALFTLAFFVSLLKRSKQKDA